MYKRRVVGVMLWEPMKQGVARPVKDTGLRLLCPRLKLGRHPFKRLGTLWLRAFLTCLGRRLGPELAARSSLWRAPQPHEAERRPHEARAAKGGEDARPRREDRAEQLAEELAR